MFESVGKSSHESAHVDGVRVYDVDAVAFLDSAHIGNEFAVIVVCTEEHRAFSVFRHIRDGLTIESTTCDLVFSQLPELNEDLTVVVVHSVNLACKASNDKRFVGILGKSEHESRVDVYVLLVLFGTRFQKRCVFEQLPCVLRTYVLRVARFVVIWRRRRNNRVVDVSATCMVARYHAENHRDNQHEQQYER